VSEKKEYILVDMLEYSEECNFSDVNCRVRDPDSEKYFGIFPSTMKFKYCEDRIEYYDPKRDIHDYIPASDCDYGCWRNYVYEGNNVLILWQMFEVPVKVMDEVVGFEYGFRIYILKPK